MSDDNKGWTEDNVREYLQHAVYLELWTVPLYLTAAYSINVPVDATTGRPEMVNLDDLPKNQDGSYDFAEFTNEQASQYAFDSVLSIAIQEMLHLELAANILNAVRPAGQPPKNGSWVKFTGEYAPSYKQPPPCLPTPPAGLTLKFGPLDQDRLNLFMWIEQKGSDAQEERFLPEYDSIGDFYHALSYGLTACWSELYPAGGQPGSLQKDDWGEAITKAIVAMSSRGVTGPRERLPRILSREAIRSLMGRAAARKGMTAGAPPQAADVAQTASALQQAGNYPFSIKIEGSPTDALALAQNAMVAISYQGEGAQGGEVPSGYVPTTGEPIEIFLDSKSHLDRFTELQQLLGKIQIIQPAQEQSGTSDTNLSYLQNVLNQSYSAFLMSLENSFASTEDVALSAMVGIGNKTLAVWQAGGVPEYDWIDPSQYKDPEQKNHYHACQGLNIIEEAGHASGACDCATGYWHACQQTNICKGQGGCGFQGDARDAQDNWVPNFNNCYNLGGCGAPIPPGQVFNANPKYPPLAQPASLQNQNVWDHARALLQDYLIKNGTLQPGQSLPPINEPSPVRRVLNPTSYPYPPKK